ncbi:hypothetical protein CFC21_112528 [Triticum aestivum]|uniref:Uncharacterized protein n=2 Tax=Triticum aestivum TaxID=4565 RepID=A0A9R1GGT6_WHEAT|nr:hypothetical protein CFC21_056204 [Triticum aestivum]KAF7047259.1 hypothetical protein CFC21_056205 [Triticum aestivum]KAF7047260.1 hypothetical protein CFC21_056206 [Triticum aestivum]KAF7047261.1 hypothetical protein CFC21_056207 [Triticum aestivum]KAF7047262.1 hypothetical protein CFC21_056208 [Triticum aestivum]
MAKMMTMIMLFLVSSLLSHSSESSQSHLQITFNVHKQKFSELDQAMQMVLPLRQPPQRRLVGADAALKESLLSLMQAIAHRMETPHGLPSIDEGAKPHPSSWMNMKTDDEEAHPATPTAAP